MDREDGSSRWALLITILLVQLYFLEMETQAFLVSIISTLSLMSSRKRKRDATFTAVVTLAVVVATCARPQMFSGSSKGREFELPRDGGEWFRNYPMDRWTARQFTRYYRVPMATFSRLVDELGPEMENNGSRSREPIDGRRLIAACLRRLATGGDLDSIADRHGYSEGRLREAMRLFCRLVRRRFQHSLFGLPTGNRLVEIMERFRVEHGVPQCAGAIDGTHIPWRPPKWITSDYKNRKGWTSIGLQLIVDSRGYILDAYTGHPGSWHDARAFRESNAGKAILAGEWPRGAGEELHGIGVTVHPYIMADAAYPGSSRVMKPFPGDKNTMSCMRRNFNYRQSSARMPVARFAKIAMGVSPSLY